MCACDIRCKFHVWFIELNVSFTKVYRSLGAGSGQNSATAGRWLLSSILSLQRQNLGTGTDQGHPPPAVCLALSILSGMKGRNPSHHRTGSAKLIQLHWSFPWTLMGIGPSHRGQKMLQIWAKLQNIFSQTSAKILMPLFSEYVCHD